MSVLSKRIGVDTSQPEVSEFDIEGISLNQNVLRLEITVNDAIGVTVLE